MQELKKMERTLEFKVGAVQTGGIIRFSHKHKGGCGANNWHCSDGHWVCFGFPRTEDGIVKGVTIYFDNEIQLKKFINDFDSAVKNYEEGK